MLNTTSPPPEPTQSMKRMCGPLLLPSLCCPLVSGLVGWWVWRWVWQRLGRVAGHRAVVVSEHPEHRLQEFRPPALSSCAKYPVNVLVDTDVREHGRHAPVAGKSRAAKRKARTSTYDERREVIAFLGGPV